MHQNFLYTSNPPICVAFYTLIYCYGEAACTRIFCTLVIHQSVLLSIPLNSIFKIQKLKATLHTQHSTFTQLHSSFVGMELKWYNILRAEVNSYFTAQQRSLYRCLVSLGWQEQKLDQHVSEDEICQHQGFTMLIQLHNYKFSLHNTASSTALVTIVVASYCLDGRNKF